MAQAKIAVVTGVSRGLGNSMARHLARSGVGVIGTYLGNEDPAREVVREIVGLGLPAAAFKLDIRDSSSFPAFVDEVRSTLVGHGVETIDYLVNNAGMGTYAAFTDTTEEQFDELMLAHVKAPFFLTQALLPLIADGGRILNVSSGLTRFTTPGYAAYATAKGAVEVLTRYQAKELGPRGIRVNTLAPGAIATDFAGGSVRDNDAVNSGISAVTALGRAGEPDDIGAAVPAILSDSLHWATGTRIELSGGMNL